VRIEWKSSLYEPGGGRQSQPSREGERGVNSTMRRRLNKKKKKKKKKAQFKTEFCSRS
jgi:hypothetical protein